MTEEISAAPAWVEQRLDQIFAHLPPGAAEARTAYLACLGQRKTPAAPSDLLGGEFTPCRQALHTRLQHLHLDPAAIATLETGLDALESELASAS